jgi:hypothetical protein
MGGRTDTPSPSRVQLCKEHTGLNSGILQMFAAWLKQSVLLHSYSDHMAVDLQV